MKYQFLTLNHNMKYILVLAVLFTLSSCKSEVKDNPKETELTTGTYRAVLEVQDDKELPFVFEVVNKQTIKVFNAEEVIETQEVRYVGDSVYIQLPVFEGYIAATFDNKLIKGDFVKESLDRVVPFTAKYDQKERFSVENKPSTDVSGIWEVVFSKDIEGDEYIAKGIFKQEGSKLTGTFRTTTGDYRFLEGVVDGDKMKLSAFDGAHAFLFTAKVTDSTMEGHFYSGNHWKEPFIAKRNATYELPHEDTLTFLKEGYDAFEFSFPDATGKMVSLQDEQFKNKIVLVQIMGTWCPNCLDESKYYVSQYEELKAKGIEIVALAFEYAKTKDKAFQSIQRLKERIGITYPILLAQYGTSDKAKAQEKLPMLNHVLSYPTTVFIDKQGKVRKIHTGFNGPATGQKYTDFQNEFNAFIDKLLNEN